MALLSASNYPDIRAAIDTSLDSTTLPDATIALAVYVGSAELWVKERDPSAESRTGDDLQHAKNAAMYMTAALLVPAVPQLTAERYLDEGYEYTRQKIDWDKLAAELRSRAEAELAAYLDASTDTQVRYRPTMFTLASGRRGR